MNVRAQGANVPPTYASRRFFKAAAKYEVLISSGNYWCRVLNFRKEKGKLFTTNHPLLVQNKTIKLTNRPTLSYEVVIASVHMLRLVNH